MQFFTISSHKTDIIYTMRHSCANPVFLAFTLLFASACEKLGATVSDGESTTTSSSTVSDSGTSSDNNNADAASSLSWTQSSPTNTGTVTANWTKSSSTLLNSQKIQFYTGSCSATFGSEITLSASAQSRTLTGMSSGTSYSFKVFSLDAQGNSVSSTCSSALTYDTTAPTVTINQSTSQIDPTIAVPILFTVVFSEAITPATFTTADITQNGSASVSGWSISDSGDHITFTLSATSITTSGTIIPSIAANLVTDVAGNNNTTSSATDNSVTHYVPTAASSLGWTQSSPTNTLNITASWTNGSTFDSLSIAFYSNSNCSGTAYATDTSISNNATTSLAVTAPAAGTYSYKITSVLPTGTVASSCSSALTIDQTAPNNASSLADSYTAGNTTIALSWALSSSSDLATQAIKIYNNAGCDDGLITTVNDNPADDTSYNVDVSGVTEGTSISYSYAITSTDTAGNQSTTSCRNMSTYTINFSPAAATSLSWTQGSSTTSTTITASWTKSTAADLSAQTINIYATNNCSGSITSTQNLSAAATSHNYTATAGNSYTFKINSSDGSLATLSACSSAIAVTSSSAPSSPNLGDLVYVEDFEDASASDGTTYTGNNESGAWISDGSYGVPWFPTYQPSIITFSNGKKGIREPTLAESGSGYGHPMWYPYITFSGEFLTHTRIKFQSILYLPVTFDFTNPAVYAENRYLFTQGNCNGSNDVCVLFTSNTKISIKLAGSEVAYITLPSKPTGGLSTPHTFIMDVEEKSNGYVQATFDGYTHTAVSIRPSHSAVSSMTMLPSGNPLANPSSGSYPHDSDLDYFSSLDEVKVWWMEPRSPWTNLTGHSQTIHSTSLAANGNNIYMFGGNAEFGTNNSLTVFNTSNNTWYSISSFQPGSDAVPVSWDHTANFVNGKMYVYGGVSSCSGGTYCSKWFEYDPTGEDASTGDGGTWNELSPTIAGGGAAPTARAHHTSWVYNDEIYIFGGYTSGGNSNSLFKYSPATNTVTNLSPTGTGPSARSLAVSGIVGDEAYIGLGNNGTSTGALSDWFKYDITDNTWTRVDTSFTGTTPSARWGSATTTLNGLIYVFAGRSSENDSVSAGTAGIDYKDIYSFNPVTLSWTQLTSPSNTERAYTDGVSANGAFYIIGGMDMTDDGAGNTSEDKVADFFKYTP